MAPHSRTLAWKVPWMEEPGRLQSMGTLKVRHDWATSLSLFTFMHWRRKWQPVLQCSCLKNPRDSGAWWAAVYGVTQSQTRLKQLSSSGWVTLRSLFNMPESWFDHLKRDGQTFKLISKLLAFLIIKAKKLQRFNSQNKLSSQAFSLGILVSIQ